MRFEIANGNRSAYGVLRAAYRVVEVAFRARASSSCFVDTARFRELGLF